VQERSREWRAERSERIGKEGKRSEEKKREEKRQIGEAIP
jgi:hypothetical protein